MSKRINLSIPDNKDWIMDDFVVLCEHMKLARSAYIMQLIEDELVKCSAVGGALAQVDDPSLLEVLKQEPPPIEMPEFLL